jgi:ABC-type sugar transport system, periplasmic component
MSSFAGCGSSQQAASDNGGDKSGKIKIGLTMSSRDQFLSTLETALTDAAKEKGDVEVIAFDAENDIQKQLSQISSFASQGVSAIIVNLVNSDSTDEIMKAAGDIPVVFVNRLPDTAILESSAKASYVGSNESEAGKLQSEFLTKYFNDKGKKELNYVLFMGTLGLQNTNARTDSVKKGLEDSGFTLVKQFEDTADFDRAKAMEKMQQFIGTKKPFDVVIANNDEMALGAVEAMKAANITGIPVVGIDATANALEAIKAGDLACSVFQDAKGQGSGALDFAYKYAKGETVDKYGWIPFQIVSKDNLADFQ